MSSERLTYLSSEYPGLSHTFILREVLALRKSGFAVDTASIRRPAHLERMGQAEQDEAARTLYIKEGLVSRSLPALWAMVRSAPSRVASAFGLMVSHCALSGPKTPLRGLAYFLEATLLAQTMQQNGSTHVHVHFANPAAWVGLLASRMLNCRFSLSVHGPDIFYDVTMHGLACKLEHADFVRVISHYARSQCARLISPLAEDGTDRWENIHIARLGVDPSEFTPRPEPKNDAPRILCVGRLVAAKGQHVLLRALHSLHKTDRNFHAVFVGGGPDTESLLAETQHLGLSEKVHFTGPVGRDEVLAQLQKADIFVLPSFAEGLPVVLMEAMSSTIPCISTRITGIPELIDHERNGLLVPASDAEALAQALDRLMQDGDLRRTMGKKGRETVVEFYDIDKNLEDLTRLFHKYGQ